MKKKKQPTKYHPHFKGGGCDLAELFNVGEGKRKIAGRKGSIWTTLIQIGEFLENARNSLDNEIKRIFISHVDQFQNGLFTQIALDIEVCLSLFIIFYFYFTYLFFEIFFFFFSFLFVFLLRLKLQFLEPTQKMISIMYQFVKR